jgi:hypothetical protein
MHHRPALVVLGRVRCQYDMRDRRREGRTIDDIASRLNVFLTGHEDQDITRRMRYVNLESLLDSTVDVVLAGGLAEEDVDGERSSRDGEARCAIVELRELHERIVSIFEQGTREERLTFSAFIVAEVTMSLRSRRRDKTTTTWSAKHPSSSRGCDSLLRRSPMRMSVLRDRSWASSRMTTL